MSENGHSSDLSPTPAASWRKPGREEVHTLPSGNVVRLRRPQIMGMARRGEIPNPLIPAAIELLEGPSKPAAERTGDDTKRSSTFLFWLCQQAFVEPRLVEENAKEGELTYDDLSDDDVEWVLVWANAPAAALEPFRDERAGDDGGGDGQDLQLPAIAAS
jgi:hypothetical protein